LILRKHPVLQISRNDIRRFSVLINLDHAGSGGSSSPRRNTLHKDSVDWCLEMFRRKLPHRQPVRCSCSFVVNNQLCFAASQQIVRMLLDYFKTQLLTASAGASAPLTITLLICNVSSEMTRPLMSF